MLVNLLFLYFKTTFFIEVNTFMILLVNSKIEVITDIFGLDHKTLANACALRIWRNKNRC